MTNFKVVDSGNHTSFVTGSVRSDDTDKPRYELIPVEALERLAMLYTRGAKVYGPNNWSRGQPFRRVFGSMLRHAFAWAKGERDEDHLAAVAWNAFALMYFEEALKKGTLPESLNDMKIPLEKSKTLSKKEIDQAIKNFADNYKPFTFETENVNK